MARTIFALCGAHVAGLAARGPDRPSDPTPRRDRSSPFGRRRLLGRIHRADQVRVTQKRALTYTNATVEDEGAP